VGSNFLERGRNLPLLSCFSKSTWFPTHCWYHLCLGYVHFCPQLPLQSWKSM